MTTGLMKLDFSFLAIESSIASFMKKTISW